MLRISDYRSTYVVDKVHCYEEIRKMFNELIRAAEASGTSVSSIVGDDTANAAFDKAAPDIKDWCTAEEQTNEQAP